jgi:competence protein ComEA
MKERFLSYITGFWQKFQGIFLLLLVGVSLFFSVKVWLRPSSLPSTEIVKLGDGVAAVKPKLTEQKSAESVKVKVNVSGAVNKPGVYELTTENTVAKALELAGGLHKDADKVYVARFVNMAKSLTNEEMLYIPYKNESTLLDLLAKSISSSTTTTATNSSTQIAKVNLNSATEAELDTLPGVGPSTAQKIIAARPFTDIEELKDVSGIGDVTFAKLKEYIYV